MQEISASPIDLSKLNPLNLVYNPSFEDHGLGAAGVPDLWVLEGTPPTLLADTGDIGYGAVSQKITADAALEGIKYTITGLKALTKYSVSVRTKVTAGADIARMLTTGAGVNMAAQDSISVTWETIKGTFTTDNAGTAVVLKLMAVADTDVVWFDGVEVNEGDGIAYHNKPSLYSDTRFKAETTNHDISVTGNQVITGLGFKPRFVYMLCHINNGYQGHWGFTDGISQKGMVTPDGAGAASKFEQSSVLISMLIAAGTYAEANWVSFDDDGLTIIWTKTGLPTGTARMQLVIFR